MKTLPPTVALPGDFASALMLRQDAGDPWWIDYYWEQAKAIATLAMQLDTLRTLEGRRIAAIGYSRGGQQFALAHNLCVSVVGDSPICCLILWEAPLPREGLVGKLPVLYIRSKQRSWWPWRERRKDNIIRRLKAAGHDVDVMLSEKRHIDSNEHGRYRHGWDRNLKHRS